MEVSVIGSSFQGNMCSRIGSKEVKLCVPRRTCSEVWFFDKNKDFVATSSVSKRRSWRNLRLKVSLNAVHTQPLQSDKLSRRESSRRSKSLDGVRLFVGLPLDSVSDCNTVNHAKAIAVGLKALKLLGIEGVELPLWWGVVEKEAMGKYDWSGYLSLAEMVQNAGLKLHVSLCFHSNTRPQISLPEWVSRIGKSQPDIFFKDRAGQYYRGCLSFAVDDLPVLDGKTPVQVYQEFIENFKSSFSDFIGSTITGITMSLGPDGELRFPSDQRQAKNRKLLGTGEFQCYDKNMLNLLKQHAESSGNPLWGLGGPHDAPTYDQLPNSNNFFKDHGGSWESAYGDFFVSWYSSQLLAHCGRLLSLTSMAFSDVDVAAYGKVPLMHSWYKTRSHPSELIAGFYNTENRNGYEKVAEIFAKNSCKMILQGMDLSDEHQPQESQSSPELLLSQIRTACRKQGVEVAGQNLSVCDPPYGFEQIKKNIVGENVVNLFTYQRMGAEFFSPDHFPSFTQFVRSLDQMEIHADDLPEEEEEAAESLQLSSESSVQMQAA